MPPRDIGHRSSQHQALRRNPRPLRFRASLTPGRPLDHFQPRNPTIRKAVQMAAHFAVSFQANTSDVHAHGDWPVQITSGRRGSASRLRSVRNGARSLLAQRKARPLPAVYRGRIRRNAASPTRPFAAPARWKNRDSLNNARLGSQRMQ